VKVDQLILRRKLDSFLLATNQELATLIYFCALREESHPTALERSAHCIPLQGSRTGLPLHAWLMPP